MLVRANCEFLIRIFADSTKFNGGTILPKPLPPKDKDLLFAKYIRHKAVRLNVDRVELDWELLECSQDGRLDAGNSFKCYMASFDYVHIHTADRRFGYQSNFKSCIDVCTCLDAADGNDGFWGYWFAVSKPYASIKLIRQCQLS